MTTGISRLIRGWLAPASVEVSLASRRAAVVFVCATCLPGLALAAAMLHTAGAQTLGESLRPAWLEASLKLDSDQPAVDHRLGMIRFYSAENPNSASGLKLLRSAAKMEPDAAPYWTDLASACAAAGDASCAEQAFARAATLNPMAPRLHWVIANYDLESGRPDAAWAEFRRLLEMDADYSGAVFHLCLRVTSEQTVWNEIVDGNRHFRVAVDWVSTLAASGRLDDAYAAWHAEAEALRAHQVVAARVSYQGLSPFVDALVDAGRGRQAKSVWMDLCRLRLVAFGGKTSDGSNLVFNGEFDHQPLNSGLDWRVHPSPGIMIGLERGAGPRRASSLRVDFTPPGNNTYEPLDQFVPVEPGQMYVLSAQIRTNGITSDSGPRLEVTDPLCGSCRAASTPAALGTSPWRRVSLTFSTGAEASFVKISVWRLRSRTYPFNISGTFWLRSVSLERVGAIPDANSSASRPQFSLIPAGIADGASR